MDCKVRVGLKEIPEGIFLIIWILTNDCLALDWLEMKVKLDLRVSLTLLSLKMITFN